MPRASQWTPGGLKNEAVCHGLRLGYGCAPSVLLISVRKCLCGVAFVLSINAPGNADDNINCQPFL